uniref:Secreted protein n=1 Tax=Talaromyces marneffei PM1 TaxID=1077442 RepID=A0A093UWM2_TALMA
MPFSIMLLVVIALHGVRPVGGNRAMWAVDSNEKACQLCTSYTFASEKDDCCLLMLYLRNGMMR